MMAGRLLFLFAVLSVHLVSASIVIGRQVDPSPTETYTYTKDTIIKPTANARFQVGIPIDVVWYIPETIENASGESFNVTIALGGEVAMELSNSFSYPGYGEQDTDFTPDETWPESNKYQIFIFMDYGIKTLTSDNFGIFGGGQTPSPTASDTEATISASKASKTAPPGTKTASNASTTSRAKTTKTSSSSASPSSTAAAAAGVSPTVLGGAIGGAIVGTLAIVGLVWFMRKRMTESRASHSSPNQSGSGNYPPPNYPAEMDGAQPWPYQQMNAHSTTSINVNNDYKGFAPTGVNELPTRMHQEPVELYAINKERVVEMPADSNWNIPPPTQQQQGQHKYVYGPQRYDR